MYALARPMLFSLDAERAHTLTLSALARAAPLVRGLYGSRAPNAPQTVMGIDFPNPVGLAAGLDKDGECIDGLAALGFGFLEVGTVTPRPQPGNPKPRLFRLPRHQALINRMGFNNRGVEHLLRRVRESDYRGVLGINIGKNFDTPAEQAVEDYLVCLRKVYAHASYVTVNVSSPNTQGLRDLQGREPLSTLFAALKKEQTRLAEGHGRWVPLAVKIAPDLDEPALTRIADTVLEYDIEAVIATNTTVARPGLQRVERAGEGGGLSGRPLAAMADAAIHMLAQRLGGAVPIIGVGGIMEAAGARAKISAGASLVQLYTGLIYRGPGLVAECAAALAEQPVAD